MYFSSQDIQTLTQKNPRILIQHPELAQTFGSQKKQSKYRNTKVYIYANGMTLFGEKNERYGKPVMIFDSIKEYDRWNELKILAKAKQIQNLDRQCVLVIREAGEYNGKKIQKIAYKADFVYVRDGKTVVEDVKPLDQKTGKYKTTKDFDLKWKMLKLKYPHYVFEVF